MLTRYLFTELCRYHLLCIIALSIIFGFFVFFEQLQDVGEDNYQTLDAFLYVLLTSPDRLIQTAPFIALFGTAFMLERFSKYNETISMMATGRSTGYLAKRIVLATLPLILAVCATMQWVAPALNKTAELHRIARTTGADKLALTQSFWTRNDQQILNIGTLTTSTSLEDILIYELDENGNLRRQTRAKSATVMDGGNWQLTGVIEKHFENGDLRLTQTDQKAWTPFADDFRATFGDLPISTLTLSQLFADIQKTKEEASRQASLLFWERLLLPFTIISMTCLAVVFMLTDTRQENAIRRMLLCFGIGILAFGFSKIAAGTTHWVARPEWVAVIPAATLLLISGMLSYYNFRSWRQ